MIVDPTSKPKRKISEAEMRQWIYATARSLTDSGLSIEEYNAITKEICDNFGPRNAGFV